MVKQKKHIAPTLSGIPKVIGGDTIRIGNTRIWLSHAPCFVSVFGALRRPRGAHLWATGKTRDTSRGAEKWTNFTLP